ncbi:Hypothetical protein CINCED_3A012645 [Cinara cedri]|uniref:Uncharacterized protein n=1 Tax=Cinara cedri TaxID=506608 RepID=A0A5E4NM97_9HEMI|nr:Hypothetical protein CINCED_3A012645 [Cinara cedri]
MAKKLILLRCVLIDDIVRYRISISSQKNGAKMNNFEWPLTRRLEKDDVLIVQLLSHQRHQCDKTLGYYTLPMDRVVVEGHVHLVDSFSAINDRNLPPKEIRDNLTRSLLQVVVSGKIKRSLV